MYVCVLSIYLHYDLHKDFYERLLKLCRCTTGLYCSSSPVCLHFLVRCLNSSSLRSSASSALGNEYFLYCIMCYFLYCISLRFVLYYYTTCCTVAYYLYCSSLYYFFVLRYTIFCTVLYYHHNYYATYFTVLYYLLFCIINATFLLHVYCSILYCRPIMLCFYCILIL